MWMRLGPSFSDTSIEKISCIWIIKRQLRDRLNDWLHVTQAHTIKMTTDFPPWLPLLNERASCSLRLAYLWKLNQRRMSPGNTTRSRHTWPWPPEASHPSSLDTLTSRPNTDDLTRRREGMGIYTTDLPFESLQSFFPHIKRKWSLWNTRIWIVFLRTFSFLFDAPTVEEA